MRPKEAFSCLRLFRASGEDSTNLLILHSSEMSDEDSADLLIFSFFEASVNKIRALARILFLC